MTRSFPGIKVILSFFLPLHPFDAISKEINREIDKPHSRCLNYSEQTHEHYWTLLPNPIKPNLS